MWSAYLFLKCCIKLTRLAYAHPPDLKTELPWTLDMIRKLVLCSSRHMVTPDECGNMLTVTTEYHNDAKVLSRLNWLDSGGQNWDMTDANLSNQLIAIFDFSFSFLFHLFQQMMFRQK